MPTIVEQRKLRKLRDELRSLVSELVSGDPSMIDQLRLRVSEKGSGISGSRGNRRLLINADAFDLLKRLSDEYGTPLEFYLKVTISHAANSENLDDVAGIVADMRNVRQSVGDLLEPPRRFHLRDGKGNAAACPRCTERMVSRRDSSGQDVRVPSLTVNETQCECLACGRIWGVRYFEWLARVIGDDSGATH